MYSNSIELAREQHAARMAERMGITVTNDNVNDFIRELTDRYRELTGLQLSDAAVQRVFQAIRLVVEIGGPVALQAAAAE